MTILSEQLILRYAERLGGWICYWLFPGLFATVMAQPSPDSPDIQGHRGCRGLLPENTIPAFLKAVELGVTTLELDVVISQDQRVVVSHEPFLSHVICRTPAGEPISQEDEKSYNLYQMPYAEIARCDCGSRPHPQFPEQENFPAYKPLLSEVIDTVEQYAKAQQLPPVRYNIETKSTPAGDGIFHPEPAEFTRLLLEVVRAKKVEDRTVIQSFDERTLQEVRKRDPILPLALLVGNTDSPQENINRLGFTPDIYSPYFELVDPSLVAFAHQRDMQVIPWTVNEPADIQRLLDWGVDGIISDYPNRVIDRTRN